MPTATIIRLYHAKPTIVNVQRRFSTIEQTLQTLCERGFVAITKGRFNHADTLFTNVINVCEKESLIFNSVYAKAHYGRAFAAYRNLFTTKDESKMKLLAHHCMLDSTVFQVMVESHYMIDFQSESKDCEMFITAAKALM